MTTNPSRGHLMEDFYTPWVDGSIVEHRKFIQALPKDNPHLPKSYIENLRNTLSDGEYRTLVLGHWEWSADENCLVKYTDVSNMFGKEVRQGSKWYLSVDVAFASDKCLIAVWNDNDVIEVVEVSKGVKPEDMIKELMTKYNVPEKQIVIDVVGAGLYLKNYFPKAYGFNAGGKVIGKEPFEHLKTQTYIKLATYISEGSIRIHSQNFREDIATECMQLIKLPAELIGGKIKMISKKQIKQNIGHSPDFLDVLSMKMVFELKSGYKISF